MASTVISPQPDAAPGPSFEGLVTELDQLVKDLESGQLSLEDSLAAFERGMSLSRKASAILDSAEQRIEQLSGTADSPVLRPLDEPL